MGYDIQTVRDAAATRWREIIATLAGLDLAILDGKHHPCPKCGGTDRFRAFDDGTGGAICNKCFSTKNGDGLSVLQWLTGKDFGQVLKQVADYIGIKPSKNGKQRSDPAEHLVFRDWNDCLVELWRMHKPPITMDAVRAFGARLATYRRQWQVIAIPIWGELLNHADPVGWILYPLNGRTLPKYTKGKPVEWVKVKVTFGSESGLVGPVDQIAAAETIWKLEGPTDALAVHGILPAGQVAVTNSNGAKERPKKWIVDLAAGKRVRVLHDADRPGQDGAMFVGEEDGRQRPGWAPAMATTATESRNVVLPYPIAPDHGKDVRDWLNEGHTIEDLEQLADQAEPVAAAEVTDEPTKVLEADDDPHRLARINLERYRNEFGRNLLYWNESWYSWKRGRYIQVTKDHLEARICASIKEEFDRLWRIAYDEYCEWQNSDEYDADKDKGPPKARKVVSPLVKYVMDATKSMCKLSVSQPLEFWIGGGPAGQCVAVRNGILNLSKLLRGADPTEIILPHSPKWFSTVMLPYEFDSDADCPNWKNFLEDVFNGDYESISALQKWFGYLLTPDKSLHKILFVIGQARSGKGTIMRVIRALLGESNVATPTLTELAGTFGLEALVDKTVALIPDARISDRVDETSVTERMLSISGDDPQNIQRKFKSTLIGHEMNVRFTLFSNLLPRFKDTSSAFISRCIFLNMPNTYVGREDTGLQGRLLAELPGILNWAIHGRLELNECKRIDQPQAGKTLLNELKSIISPVSQFIEEECELNPEYQCDTKDLFHEWERWCDANDVSHPGTIQSFSRRLKAIKPTVDTVQLRVGASRFRKFTGIRKLEEACGTQTKTGFA
jgi:putative DNA primase/helicase